MSAGVTREQPLDVREYLAPVWRRRWLIALLVVLAAGGAYFLAARQRSADQRHRVYAASTEVYIEIANPTDLIGATTVAPNPPNGQQMSDLATLFTAQAITQAVSRALGTPVSAAGTVDASLLTTGSAATYGTSIIVLSTTSPSPQLAARLANTFVAQFLASRRQAEAAAARAQAGALSTQLHSLPTTPASAAERQALRLQIVQLRAAALNPSAGAYQISPAVTPVAPVATAGAPAPVLDAVIGGVVALLLGVGVAFALSVFDRRLRRVTAIEASYRVPVLGVLPHVSATARVVDGRVIVPSEFIETLRSLRVSLRLIGERSPIRSLVVTSALPGEGKSTVAAHLALAYVESGERVLLIDADLRRPSVAAWFDVRPAAGLLQVLRGEASMAEAVVPLYGPEADEHRNGHNGNGGPSRALAGRGSLSILAHGGIADVPTVLLATRGMASVLEAARERYDVVIVDTAPILAVADTVPLLGSADAVLLVARLGATSRDAADRLVEVIARVPDANVVGVVANDAHDSLVGDGYAGLYGSGRGGYGYGYADGNGRSGRRWFAAR